MNPKTLEEPAQGGSYVREADGKLTRTGGTEPAPQRDKRQAEQAAASKPTPAPAKAADAKQE